MCGVSVVKNNIQTTAEALAAQCNEDKNQEHLAQKAHLLRPEFICPNLSG